MFPKSVLYLYFPFRKSSLAKNVFSIKKSFINFFNWKYCSSAAECQRGPFFAYKRLHTKLRTSVICIVHTVPVISLGHCLRNTFFRPILSIFDQIQNHRHRGERKFSCGSPCFGFISLSFHLFFLISKKISKNSSAAELC